MSHDRIAAASHIGAALLAAVLGAVSIALAGGMLSEGSGTARSGRVAWLGANLAAGQVVDCPA